MVGLVLCSSIGHTEHHDSWNEMLKSGERRDWVDHNTLSIFDIQKGIEFEAVVPIIAFITSLAENFDTTFHLSIFNSVVRFIQPPLSFAACYPILYPGYSYFMYIEMNM